ncbi:MAG TPA: T9SS type A sorting domain-containing protein, partial [Ohtaekwangia sp.]|nr:T9SS type A sorting domain-containing protein [Ohtaekwangia sp.]
LYVSTSGSDITGTGSTTAPYKTIQHGINQASDNDVVIVSNGTYTEHLDFGGKQVRVSSHYLINNDARHIEETIIDGANNGQVAIFSKGESRNAGLYGLTIQHGYANGSNWPTYEGGGLYIVDSSPTLMDLVVKNNKSNYRGGGVYIENGSPWMERVTVSSNQTVQLYASGGGMYMENAQSVIKDCSFVSNSTQADGGGIFLGYNAKPDMLNVMISDNTAGGGGGGLYIASNSLQLKKMLIINNNASLGGGIYSSASNNVISSTVVAGNAASTEGGAIYYMGNEANPKLETVTLHNNVSPLGNEIKTNGTAKVVVTNSIVWNESGTPISGSAIITYSDVSGGHAGTGNINLDPKLLNPANGDFSLDKSSPCIDSGNPSMADPNGSRADMGALPYDRPVIIGVVSPIVINEDDERYLYPTEFLVANTGDDFAGAYTVVPKAGLNYTTSGSIIKPDADFYGTLVVPVTVTNNHKTSQEFNLTVIVNPINDAPVITGAKEFIIEDINALTLSINDVDVTDIDSEFSTLTFEVLPGTNYTVKENAIQVVPNFTGELQVSIRVGDGSAWSEVYPVIVNVKLVTALEHSFNRNLTLYPNPARTTFYLANITGKANIQMYSAHGSAVNIEPSSEGGLVIINVSHLVEGPYILRIQTNGGTTWRKVIVVN